MSEDSAYLLGANGPSCAAGLHTILTADRHFDRIPGLTRIDPGELTR